MDSYQKGVMGIPLEVSVYRIREQSIAVAFCLFLERAFVAQIPIELISNGNRVIAGQQAIVNYPAPMQLQFRVKPTIVPTSIIYVIPSFRILVWNFSKYSGVLQVPRAIRSSQALIFNFLPFEASEF